AIGTVMQWIPHVNLGAFPDTSGTGGSCAGVATGTRGLGWSVARFRGHLCPRGAPPGRLGGRLPPGPASPYNGAPPAHRDAAPAPASGLFGPGARASSHARARGHAMKLTGEFCESLYSTMVKIRRFDEKVAELFQQGIVKGTAHSYVGQEAVAA